MPLLGVFKIPRVPGMESGLIAGNKPRDASVHTFTAAFTFLRSSGALASASMPFILAMRSFLDGVGASSLKLTRPGDLCEPLRESGLESYPPEVSKARGLKFVPGDWLPYVVGAGLRWGFGGEIFF